jgi:hypothetical protein
VALSYSIVRDSDYRGLQCDAHLLELVARGIKHNRLCICFILCNTIRLRYPATSLGRLLGFHEVKAPESFRHSAL